MYKTQRNTESRGRVTEQIMEFMSLLKSGKPGGSARTITTTSTTTIATTVLRAEAAAGEDCEDEGPFFDLDFAAPTVEEEERRGKERYSLETDSESESDESASESGSVRRDHILSLSPSDDLFFKGRLLPLEPSVRLSRSSSSASTSKPQVAAFLLKSAAKLRVFKLGLRKKGPKSAPVDVSDTATPAATAESPKQQQQRRSQFLVKFNLEEEPAASIFTRDSSSSSRSSGSSRSARLFSHDGLSPWEDKKMHTDVLQRYLNKIKPLYARVSKRYGEMLRFSGPLNSGGAGKVRPAAEGGDTGGGEKDGTASTAASSGSKCERPQNGSIPSGLKVVGRRLRKSRSASAAVNAVRSPAPARRDDSLLAQHDGIQSAIAHCKRSFNRGSDLSEPPLTRSMSEPGNARTAEASAKGEV